MNRRRFALSLPVLGLSRAQAQATPGAVQFTPDIEPLVREIETMPREKSAEWLAARMRAGKPHRESLAAVFLAGIRNVNPRPPGFALHCVFLGHAAHELSLRAPAGVRAMPLFHVLDDFKSAQARDAGAKPGDYTMRKLAPSKASAADLAAAMEAWDLERAEQAAAALARSGAKPAAVFEQLWKYGARDYRNIGHKAIFTANACRTLETIGWQHAEPVLRSLALGLLDFERTLSMNGYALDDQCFATNEKLARAWPAGGASRGSAELLAAMRSASVAELCAETARSLNAGSLNAAGVWDAVHLFAAELRLRSTGANAIAGIHAVTAANGLHTAWRRAASPRLRGLLLLQAVGWMGQFQNFAASRAGLLSATSLKDLQPIGGTVDEALGAIAAKPVEAAARMLPLAASAEHRGPLVEGLLRYAITRADEVHYYKYLVSILESEALVSPAASPALLASAALYAKGPSSPEPVWAERARAALSPQA
ncbi:MAG: hypothetical protein FJW31_11435 [Acidobacteria bacterium]|nr:hypothetical protein [Acidobacteriota bacterium]